MTLVVIFARYFCWWFRFGCLRISDLVFSRSYGKHVLSRPFFGGLLSVDVSRGNPPRLLYLQGERFIEERYVVRELTPRGATVIDVGANVGHYVLMISHYGESPQIIAIEPEPSNLVELRQNLSQNSLHNVSVIEAAAAAQSGTVMLKLGLNARINGEAGDINVPAISLDSLGLGSVGFIKIDVEGFELSVLRGAVNILRDHRPNLFIEVHPMMQPEGSDISALIELVKTFYPRVFVVVKKLRHKVWCRFSMEYFGASSLQAIELSRCHVLPSSIFWLACTADAEIAAKVGCLSADQ